MADIRLLATDLDGTLIGGANEFPLYADFREVIGELREENQTIWVACTGRSLGSFRKFFSPMRMMGVSPDFVIVNHAFIYSVTQFGYLPHLIWNLLIRFRLWSSNFRVRDAIDEWHEMITGVSLGVTTVRRRRNRLCLRFDSQDSANVAANLLREKVEAYPQLQVFQYLMEVDVRSIPFTKGLAVSELSRHVGVSSENILAIGDGHNDISMLDGSVAGMVGCPLNAEPEVSEVVHKHGGHVARKRSLAGVMEILKAYRTGQVKSELPSDWKAPSQTYNPRRRRSDRTTSHRRKRRTMSMWVFGGMIYSVLAVLAHFNLIPYVSGLIILPVTLLLKVMEKLILWIG